MENENLKAWHNATKNNIKKNNRIFQQKQIDLIKIMAEMYGIEVLNAEIDDFCRVQIEFSIDFVEAHHAEFYYYYERIIKSMTALDLVEISIELRR